MNLTITRGRNDSPIIDLSDNNPDELIAVLKEIAAERPDYVYPHVDSKPGKPGTCHYAREGSPSCIAGNWLSRLGVSTEILAELDDILRFDLTYELEGYDEKVGAGFTTLVDSGVILLPDPSVEEIVGGAQDLQDEGNAWGECVK